METIIDLSDVRAFIKEIEGVIENCLNLMDSNMRYSYLKAWVDLKITEIKMMVKQGCML